MAPKHILVVEDDQDIRENLALCLEIAGYRVSTAEEGSAALEFLRGTDDRPDLIILDLMMHGMDGIGFLKVVREENANDLALIPVLIATAAGSERITQLPPSAGVLRKPFDLDALYAKVEKICNPSSQNVNATQATSSESSSKSPTDF